MRTELPPDFSGVPVDEDSAVRAAASILDFPGADGMEVLVLGSRTGVTRYARSEVIQNTERHEVRAYVRAVVGSKNATATTNQLDEKHMREAASRAMEAAAASPDDEDWPGLAKPEEVGAAPALFRWDAATAAASPVARARAVKDILAVAGDNAAGVYETSSHSYGVFSSTGMHCYDAHTRSVATCLVDTGESTGWDEASSHASDRIDVVAMARRAADKAERAAGAVDSHSGDYHVVLEASAVATLIDYLSFTGFGAKQVLEGESFLSTRAGEQVAAPTVTVADDAAHPSSVGIGFDFEGVPRTRVEVIAAGTATGPVTDRRTAPLIEAPVTGHASGSNEFGPYAANVVLEPGGAGDDELIAGVDDGLLVTRFHYVNVLDRPTTLLTGMTRDGTFRIRGGEIAEPVHNLRFTQSALDALHATDGVGSVLESFAPEWSSFGSTAAPALRIAGFSFTSTTSH